MDLNAKMIPFETIQGLGGGNKRRVGVQGGESKYDIFDTL
jgi:hypothetical protein